jgi:hypothetical protein
MKLTRTPMRVLLKKKSVRILLLLVTAVFATFWFVEPAQTPPRGSGELMQAIVYHDGSS